MILYIGCLKIQMRVGNVSFLETLVALLDADKCWSIGFLEIIVTFDILVVMKYEEG